MDSSRRIKQRYTFTSKILILLQYEDLRSLNERQLYKVKRDIEKLSYINNNTDYKIIYLWETEINNNEYKKY